MSESIPKNISELKTALLKIQDELKQGLVVNWQFSFFHFSLGNSGG